MSDLRFKEESGGSRKQDVKNKSTIWRDLKITVLAAVGIGLMLAGYGCGGGGSQDISSQTVSGVVSVGATLSGEVTVKDTQGTERKTVIAGDGSFALDVTGMKRPLVLRAIGNNNGVSYTLYSFASGPGTANINPFTNILVANAAGVNDPSQVFANPDLNTLQKIETQLPHSITDLQTKLKPLLKNYSAESINPFSDHFVADGTHLDGVFDGVKISLVGGVLTITNALTSVVIFTGQVMDIAAGYLNPDTGSLPAPGPVPDIPAGLSAATGANQVTLSWTAVGNATSYNIYWSKTAGVTTTGGTKIAGATNPHIHTGLTAATKYYYIVTAVNGAGESAASAEVSATTNSTPVPPALPAAPTGISATGGTKQVTLSWSAVPTATSYNIYWSTTSGVTVANGTKITGATSPAVHTGLLDSTTYYYVVTAVNSTGEGAASVQVAATTITPAPVPVVPSAPAGLTASGGTQSVTLSWSVVSQATSCNLYWSTSSGVTKANGTRIAGVTSPYVQTGLSAGTTYYYVATAAPPPAIPAAPTGVTATGGLKQVTVTWAASPGATSYNIYWSKTAGVTTVTGTKITGAASPYVQTGLTDGTIYYYIVTAANTSGESAASSQVSATTTAAPPTVPAAPAGVTAVGGSKQVTVSWSAVSGATSYNIYWSTTTGVTTATGTKITGAASPYIHTGRLDSTAYYYIVTATAIDGAALYASKCQSCHGPQASTDIVGRTLQSVKNAGMTFGLTDAELQAILNVLP